MQEKAGCTAGRIDAERGSARTISHIEPSALAPARQSVSSVVTIRVRQPLRGSRGHPP